MRLLEFLLYALSEKMLLIQADIGLTKTAIVKLFMK